jgi:hypothetical protein
LGASSVGDIVGDVTCGISGDIGSWVRYNIGSWVGCGIGDGIDWLHHFILTTPLFSDGWKGSVVVVVAMMKRSL